MIYINIHHSSELGDILFMILNGLNLSVEYKLNLNIIDNDKSESDKPNFKIYDMFKNINICTNAPDDSIEIKEQTEFYYDKIILDQKNNYKITGYFQSHKYFYDNIEKIKNILFENCKEKYDYCKNKFNSMTTPNKKNVMIHIRRGDYVKYASYLMESEHFMKSLDVFFSKNNRKKYNIYLFTDDIEEVKKWKFYEKYNPTFIDETDPEKIFLFMTLFDHYIISNSSLSLGAYYLRKNRDASITMPPIWIDGYFNYNDMIPSDALHIDVLNKLKNTYVINLDYRTDRKCSSLNELKNISSEVTIFNAIKNSKGAIGCTMSHIAVLKNAIYKKLDYVFICEDDIVLLNDRYILFVVNEIISKAKWDVIGVVGVSIGELPTNNKFINKTYNYQTLTGYIINGSYMNKLLNNFETGLNYLMNDYTKPKYAIDIYWKLLQKEDNFYTLKKKYACQLPGSSNIEDRFVDYTRMFKLENMKFNKYFYDIPIFNLKKISDIVNIDKYFHDHKNIIIVINCIEINQKLIKLSYDEIINNNYDLIQLQNQCNLAEFNKNIRCGNIFNTYVNETSNAYLLKNNLLKKIIEHTNKYIINDKFNYNIIKSCKLNKPIYFSADDAIWMKYYNIVNLFDKIYVLKLSKYKINYNILNIFNKSKNDITEINVLNFEKNTIEKTIENIKLDAKNNKHNRFMIINNNVNIHDNYFDDVYATMMQNNQNVIKFSNNDFSCIILNNVNSDGMMNDK